MQQYFDAQMRLLREAGKQFAEQYPEQARQLNVDSLKERDPNIERLLEGVAYFTAHIQQRLDEAIPEVSEQVLRQLCPLLLNCYPSTTVLQFTPAPGMQSGQIIPRGLEVTSPAVSEENARCHFRSCHTLTVAPLMLTGVAYDETHNGSELRIGLRWCCHGAPEAYDLSRLSFYLCGDMPLCCSLFQLMTRGSEAVVVNFDNTSLHGAGEHGEQLLPLDACQPQYFDVDGGLLPHAGDCHPGYGLLLDYFCAKDRLLFVSLSGLDQVAMPLHPGDFTLIFRSDTRLPLGHQLSAQNILLNCVPAINLFNADAEPVRLERGRSDYLITASQHQPGDVFTYSVDKVSGLDPHSGQVHRYVPRYRRVYQDGERLYSLHIKDIGTTVPAHYLRVPAVSDCPDENLSIQLTAFNGDWPRQRLAKGELHLGARQLPTVVKVSNVTRPGRIFSPPSGPAHWQLISLLTTQSSTLMQTEHLKRLLTLLDWSATPDNRQRIAAIREIATQPINQIRRGVFVKGVEIRLLMDEQKLSCHSDLYHFTTMLHHFFVMSAPLNEGVQTRVECVPSYQQYLWPLRTGRRACF